MISHPSAWTARTVAVEGGLLTVAESRPDADGAAPLPVLAVLAVHGITASHRCFTPLADRLPGWRIVAPDLRGRGRSNGLPAPYTLVQHADDLLCVLDALAIERAVVVGHSMGAFVAARLAERHPDRVSALVLVDGGLPLPTASPDALGPALDRLSMTFATAADYLDFWREHPAFRGADWSAAVEDYVRYDLEPTGEPGQHLRTSARRDAVLTNRAELDGRDGYAEALTGLSHPITFLRAARGLLDQPDGLYSPDRVATWIARIAAATAVEVPDVNHYTILMGDVGATAVAQVIKNLGSGPHDADSAQPGPSRSPRISTTESRRTP